MFFSNDLYLKEIKVVAQKIGIHDGTILVTGATGLIGSCIIDTLLYANYYFKRNFYVIAVGRSYDRLVKRFSSFLKCGSLRFIVQDICKEIELDENIDYIIHAASNADPVSYSLYPAETLLTNIEGTKNILNLCKKNKNARVLYTSSFEVYGNANCDVYNENTYGYIDIYNIRSCYPESKRCAENLIKCYISEYGINAIIGRLCSVYGPTMMASDSKAHAQFIHNAINGKEIVLKSKGVQKRTYAYVIDVVDAILFLLVKGNSGECYNISNEKSVATIADVATTVSDITGCKIIYDIPNEIENKGFSVPINCVLDNSKLRGLGWEGRYKLYEGLANTIYVMKSIMI